MDLGMNALKTGFMKIYSNVSLLPYHTFQIDVRAETLMVIENEEDLKRMPDLFNKKFLILGGGSNVLFTENFQGIVLKNEIKGKSLVKETEEEVWLNIKSGEIWHDVVMWSVENNWNGIENLALIPGTMGAAPIQNIGAYGVEIKDVLEYVEGYDLQSKKMVRWSNQECAFGYRESVFKSLLKNKVFITAVGIKLKKKNHRYKTEYGTIREELEKQGVRELSPKVIADVVIKIRMSKLPDPKGMGNAGSFFKNPEVDEGVYRDLKERYPNIVAFSMPDKKYKLAAGWLIEQCGLKGYAYKGAAVHSKQALVLVNQHQATGKEVLELAQRIKEEVFKKFGVYLEEEVHIIK